jgi:hypothetical protein
MMDRGHKIDPYTGEIIEWAMQVHTANNLHDAEVDKLLKYYEEYVEELLEWEDYFSDIRWGSDGGATHDEYVGKMPHPRIRRSLKEFQREKEIEMSWQNQSIDFDTKIADAIGKAMRHAERVSKRDHIKADRVERVNQFVVSLRRELCGMDKSVISAAQISSALIDKAMWYDIGIVTLNFNQYGVLKREQVQKWIDLANRLKNGVDAARYQIEGDLEELERGLTGCLSAVNDAKRVNQESENITSGLCQLFE